MADVRLRVGADSSEARNQIQTLERQVNGMIRRAEALGATQLISREQQQALESVGRGAQFAGLAIGGLGALAVKGAAQLESLELGLETVFGSAEAATRIFQELTTAAARTPFEIPDLARGASNLKAFGIAAGDVIPRLLQLGDLSRGQTSEFTRLINAYGQAAANQRLLREELNRFIEAGVPILATLKGVVEAQRGTTLSQIEFNKAISDGELDIGHLNVALDQLTDAGGQFAGALDRASQTLEGRFSTVVDEFRFAGAELAEGAATGGARRHLRPDRPGPGAAGSKALTRFAGSRWQPVGWRGWSRPAPALLLSRAPLRRSGRLRRPPGR